MDDHDLFRETVRRVLTSAGYAVIGEAVDGATAITATRALEPDLVLLDVQLPDLDGFQVAAKLSRLPKAPVVILVSGRDEADYGGLVRRSTARAFIPKAELSEARLTAALLDGHRG